MRYSVVNIWDIVIQAAAVIAAAGVIATLIYKAVHVVDEQKTQSEEINDIKVEQQLMTYGLLACLKGLAEKGCDGPVHEAIDKLEKHLNIQAHK